MERICIETWSWTMITISVDPTAVKQLQDDLYQRMQLMLPVAAVMTATHHTNRVNRGA
jgi:hypothetical protein